MSIIQRHGFMQKGLALFAAFGWGLSAAQAQVTVCASTSVGGVLGNGESPGIAGARLSADGRYVVFRSTATNLTTDLTNGASQIFRKDLVTGAIQMVSLAYGQTTVGGNGHSHNPCVSADGRYVSFTSFASDLIPGSGPGTYTPVGSGGDLNGVKDVFVRDMVLGTTVLASVDSFGAQGNGESDSPAISADGRFVAFRSMAGNLAAGDANAKSDVFIRDVVNGTTQLVSSTSGGVSGNGVSGFSQIAMTPDGRYVGFTSSSSNLVASDSNGVDDVFVRDTVLGSTVRVSVGAGGAQGNGGSYTAAFGSTNRFVVFSSNATNLTSGDTNAVRDVFIRDVTSGTTTRLSVDSNGKQGNGASGATNDGWGVSSISADGRYVAFQSAATNLSGLLKDRNGVIDVFVRDRTTSKTSVASVSVAGVLGNGASEGPCLSADGAYLMFHSEATDLVSSDLNGVVDVFVRGPAR